MPVMEPAEPNMSPLESLPAELLEQIFLQSLNINLPLASPHLSSMLSSTHTKAAVVSMVFSTNAPYKLEHVDELSHILCTESAIDTDVAIKELQSRILACRWMTWDFMMICMEKFFVRTLLREFQIQNLLWPEGLRITDEPLRPWNGGAPVQESVVRDFVHERLRLDARERLLNEDNIEEDFKNVAFESRHQTCVWGPDDDTLKVTLGISSQLGVLTLTALRGTDFSSQSWNCLWIRDTSPVIPLKLLHGPWTGDKLSFIDVLYYSGAQIDQTNQIHMEMVRKGLMEAIREDNHRAVDVIMRCWDFWPSDPPSLILPETAHLRVAVIERGCRRNIVKRLLRMGPLEIDPTVVSWAEEKKAQGDESGQWLLDELEENSLIGGPLDGRLVTGLGHDHLARVFF